MKECLRRATKEDVDLLFEWVNEPGVRQNSFQMNEISYETHCQWFYSKLKDREVQIYIYEVDDIPIGQIRFELEDRKISIDYSVDVKYRGNGFAGKMITLAEQELKKEKWKADNIIAEVKKENVSSQKVFLKAGYKRQETTDIICFLKKWENK